MAARGNYTGAAVSAVTEGAIAVASTLFTGGFGYVAYKAWRYGKVVARAKNIDKIRTARLASEATARELKNARQRGVNRAKSAERKLVKNGHPGTADDGGWTLAERKRIAEKGQYPSDVRWHHINDVKRNPDQADLADNVIPSRGGTAGHVSKYHPNGTQAGSSGTLLDREQLLNDHLNGN